ncbi:MAG: uroporphyrinogen decarboxylase family protein [Candidatus Hydrogenedentota bacterium]
MPRSYTNDLLIRALNGETTPRPPVWMMRQAGRTDPLYNEYKAKADLPLEKLFQHPEQAAHISLLPKRLGVDAIIYFQDILTPLGPMGCEFLFRPGPVTENPINTRDDIDRLTRYEMPEQVGFIGETFDRLHATLDGELPVLGFAGAPMTLAVFMIEGKSFGTKAERAFNFFENHPEDTHVLLEKLTEMTIRYLEYQIEHGAASVQLFESAAFLCTPDQYRTLALPYQQKIFAALKGKVPTIQFAREWDNIAELGEAGADVVSLPSSISIHEARDVLGIDQVVQGNLSNRLLCDGPLEAIESAARACVEAGESRGHIFNLDHGLLRETPYENIQFLMRVLKGN